VNLTAKENKVQKTAEKLFKEQPNLCLHNAFDFIRTIKGNGFLIKLQYFLLFS